MGPAFASDIQHQPQRCGSLRGSVRVPGDKSISIEPCSSGDSRRRDDHRGLLPAEDPLSTAACLRSMGVGISAIEPDQSCGFKE